MEEQKSVEDDDIDVDHYFLPGGILDTPSQREEDMIGGSLLDEIGGVGNVVSVANSVAESREGEKDPWSAFEATTSNYPSERWHRVMMTVATVATLMTWTIDNTIYDLKSNVLGFDQSCA